MTSACISTSPTAFFCCFFFAVGPGGPAGIIPAKTSGWVSGACRQARAGVPGPPRPRACARGRRRGRTGGAPQRQARPRCAPVGSPFRSAGGKAATSQWKPAAAHWQFHWTCSTLPVGPRLFPLGWRVGLSKGDSKSEWEHQGAARSGEGGASARRGDPRRVPLAGASGGRATTVCAPLPPGYLPSPNCALSLVFGHFEDQVIVIDDVWTTSAVRVMQIFGVALQTLSRARATLAKRGHPPWPVRRFGAFAQRGREHCAFWATSKRRHVESAKRWQPSTTRIARPDRG